MAYFQKVDAKNKQGYRWKCTKEAPRHPLTGKRRQVTRRGETKREAEDKVDEGIKTLEKMDTGESNQYLGDITVSDLFDKWFEVVMKRKLKESTFREYSNCVKYRILPVIGNYKVANLNSVHLQVYVNNLIDEDLSPRYIEYITTILYGALDTARKWKIIPDNPMIDVERPRPRRVDYKTWTIDEVNRILSVSKTIDTQMYTLICVALKTGLRRGEILALKWQNIDLENLTLYVKLSLMLGKKGYVLDAPKTQTSNRKVRFGDALENDLKRWKAKQNEIKMAVRKMYHDNDLVFSNSVGGVLDPRSMSDKFKNLIELSGVTEIRFHDLRHTHATLALEAGMDLKDVQDRLGHANIQTTGNVYAHVTENKRKHSSKLFDEYMEKGND